MASTAPVKLALLGCGGNQRMAHVPRLLKRVEVGDVTIVAACDPVADNLDKLAEKLTDFRRYEDYQQMLATEDLDAVSISTPHTMHCQHILDSFDAGCHVLTEKPMVCSVGEAQQVLAKRDETGLQLQIGYQRHFAGGYRWAREFIASGQLGAIRYVTAWQCQSWYQGRIKNPQAWRGHMSLSGGGQLNDSGSHMVDILLWITGLQPRSVCAQIDNRGLEVDILSSVGVRCDGDALMNIAIIGDSVRRFDEEVVIWGDKATLQICGAAANPVKVNYVDDPGKTLEIPPVDRPDGTDPDANFLDAILGRGECEVPGECGLKVIQLTEAAWQAAKEGRTIEVA